MTRQKIKTNMQMSKEMKMYKTILDYYTRERTFPSARHLTNCTGLETNSVVVILRSLRKDGYIKQGKGGVIIELSLMKTNWMTKPILIK